MKIGKCYFPVYQNNFILLEYDMVIAKNIYGIFFCKMVFKIELMVECAKRAYYLERISFRENTLLET